MTIEEKIAELKDKREQLKEGGGKDRIEKQHKSGKLTARERVDRLVDSGSFRKSGSLRSIAPPCSAWPIRNFPADGVVTGAAPWTAG